MTQMQTNPKEITGSGTPQPFLLRTCGAEDADALALVGAATFLETYAGVLPKNAILAHCQKHHFAERYREWMAEPNVHIAIVEVHDAPVGYAVVCPVDASIGGQAGDMELRRIYLLHRFHRTGMGKALMDWALEKTAALGHRRLVLGVYPGNTPAIRFYKRIGFQEVGERCFQVGELLFVDPVLAIEIGSETRNTK
ncbi:MAG: GNAT family N-acetyltransferase [Bryobacteraceae bacterium]